jgi:AcrR family transcriptional regulator
LPEEEIRAKVISASRVVFSSSGYRAATVQDIIDEAGIARATFYRYFTDKRHAFHELISSFLKVLYDTARDYMLTETDDIEVLIERISESLELFYTLFRENREIVSVYLHEAMFHDPGLYDIWKSFDSSVAAVFSGMLKKGIVMGTFRPMNTEKVASALITIFLQVPYREIISGKEVINDVGSMAEEMAVFAVEGLIQRNTRSGANVVNTNLAGNRRKEETA